MEKVSGQNRKIGFWRCGDGPGRSRRNCWCPSAAPSAESSSAAQLPHATSPQFAVFARGSAVVITPASLPGGQTAVGADLVLKHLFAGFATFWWRWNVFLDASLFGVQALLFGLALCLAS